MIYPNCCGCVGDDVLIDAVDKGNGQPPQIDDFSLVQQKSKVYIPHTFGISFTSGGTELFTTTHDRIAQANALFGDRDGPI